MSKVAVVTGANKGLGLAIVRGLCKSKQFDGGVYLTSRNEQRGLAAIKQLQQEGLNPKYHQLDVTNSDSRKALHEHILAEHGGIDVLVNNAGVMLLPSDPRPWVEKVEVTMDINYRAQLAMCKLFLPNVRANGRIVNMSSEAASIAMGLCSDSIRSQVISPEVDLPFLENLMQNYTEKAKQGCPEKYGFPDNIIAPYMMSKVGLTLMTVILSRNCKNNILINACDPGIVDTDIIKTFNAPGVVKLHVDEGADTALYLALLPAATNHPQGKLYKEREDATQPFFDGDSHVQAWKDGSAAQMF